MDETVEVEDLDAPDSAVAVAAVGVAAAVVDDVAADRRLFSLALTMGREVLGKL